MDRLKLPFSLEMEMDLFLANCVSPTLPTPHKPDSNGHIRSGEKKRTNACCLINGHWQYRAGYWRSRTTTHQCHALRELTSRLKINDWLQREV